MDHSIEIIRYKDIKKRFTYNYEEKLERLGMRQRHCRIIFDYPTLFLTLGLNAVSRTDKRFQIDLDREGYLSTDYKNFEVKAVIEHEQLKEFEIIFAVALDDFGFAVHQSLGLETVINNSFLSLEVNNRDLIMLEPEVTLKGYFKGHGYDLAVAEQFQCYVHLQIYGILKNDPQIPSWKIKVVKALVAYRNYDYENVVKLVHSAFEMFLKDKVEEDQRKNSFDALYILVMRQSGLFTSEGGNNKNLTRWETIFLNQFIEYKSIKKQRNENTHVKHKDISKEKAEVFAVIAITFIYSISFKRNMFIEPWIKGK